MSFNRSGSIWSEQRTLATARGNIPWKFGALLTVWPFKKLDCDRFLPVCVFENLTWWTGIVEQKVFQLKNLQAKSCFNQIRNTENDITYLIFHQQSCCINWNFMSKSWIRLFLMWRQDIVWRHHFIWTSRAPWLGYPSVPNSALTTVISGCDLQSSQGYLIPFSLWWEMSNLVSSCQARLKLHSCHLLPS